MIEKLKSNKKMVIIVLSLLVVIGISFAFVAPIILDGASNNTDIVAESVDRLTFKVDEELFLNVTQQNLVEGGDNLQDEAVATASLLANNTNNTASYNYYVYLRIDKNEYVYTTDDRKPEIILSVKDPTNTEIKSIRGMVYNQALQGFDITTYEGLINIASNYNISSNSSTTATIQDWTFTISFINLETNQKDNANKELKIAMVFQEEPIGEEDPDLLLANYMINNQVVTSGDGLYYIEDEGRYIYKGTDPDNRILLGEEVYRIVSLEADNTLKIVKVSDIPTSIAFDASGYRTTAANPYCDRASTISSGTTYYGCHVWGIHTNILGNSASYTTQNSSLADYLNTTFYDSLSTEVTSRIIEKDFNVGLIGATGLATIKTQESALKWRGKIGAINVTDVMQVGNITSINTSNSANYLARLSSNLLFLWTMNGYSTPNTYDVWMIINGSSIGQRRASRTDQSVSAGTAIFGTLPTFYINGVLAASGTGTVDDPFAFI